MAFAAPRGAARDKCQVASGEAGSDSWGVSSRTIYHCQETAAECRPLAVIHWEARSCLCGASARVLWALQESLPTAFGRR